MTQDIWEKLYSEAKKVQKSRMISPFIEAGGVASAILTKSRNIYVGVCIDTASTQNAKNREQIIKKLKELAANVV